MKKLVFRLPILLVPAFFLHLSFIYNETSYYFLVLVSFFISLLVILPTLFSNKHIHIPTKINLKFKKEKKVNKKFKRLRFINLISISVPTIVFVICFLLISIFSLRNSNNGNLFISYLSSLLSFLGKNSYYFLFGVFILIILTYFILRKIKNIKGKPAIREIGNIIGINICGLLLGLLISFFLLFPLAFIQLNLVSIASSVSPQILQVTASSEEISKKLNSMDKPPQIISYNKNGLLLSLIGNADKENIYLKVLNLIPPYLVVPYKDTKNSYFMVNNKLVIKDLAPLEIEKISPQLGKLLVKNNFNSRFIKDIPEVKVIGRQEYLDYRIKGINKELEKIDDYIGEIKTEISNYYGAIQTAKNNIAGWQNGIQTSISQKESEYKTCKSAGYYSYYFGTFYPYYTESYCRSLGAKWDKYIDEANEGIKVNNKNIAYYQSQLKLWNQNLDYFQTARDLTENSKLQTPQELGIFEPNNHIKIAIDETSSNKVVDYFETLTHEYLHYTSYVNEEQVLLPFFEEGLSELYSRQTIKKSLGANTNIGYPLYVAIIKEIIKKIPEKELEDIYFNKNQLMLESLLNTAYGENFYKDYELYFSVISYMPQREALSMANAIMLKVGGKPLTESDIYSSEADSN